MKRPPLSGTPYDKIDGKIDIYGTLETSALDSVLTSGLWNFGKPEEQEFLLTVVNYEHALTRANALFGIVNADLLQTGTAQQNMLKAERHQKNVNASEWYGALKLQHQKMHELLLRNYRWAVMEQGKW